jgi:hypothetical protein
MRKTNGIMVGCVVTLLAQGCELQKIDPVNWGSAGSLNGNGGSFGEVAKGGTSSIGGSSANGGSPINGSPINGGTNASGGASAGGGPTSITGSSATGGATSTGGSAATTAAGGCDLSKPFGTPQRAVDTLDSTSSEDSISVSSDGLSAIVSVAAANNKFHLKFYTRSLVTQHFSNQQALSGDTNINDATLVQRQPRLTRDGLHLFYTSVGTNYTVVLYSSRSSTFASFDAPTGVDGTGTAIVNTTASTDSPWIDDRNNVFYWSTDGIIRSATVSLAGIALLFTNATIAEGIHLTSMIQDLHPMLSGDQLTLYFSSNRVSGADASHMTYQRIWKASRSSTMTGWSDPSLVSELDQFGTTYMPSDISSDGCTIYFSGYVTGENAHLYQATKPL